MSVLSQFPLQTELINVSGASHSIITVGAGVLVGVLVGVGAGVPVGVTVGVTVGVGLGCTGTHPINVTLQSPFKYPGLS